MIWSLSQERGTDLYICIFPFHVSLRDIVSSAQLCVRRRILHIAPRASFPSFVWGIVCGAFIYLLCLIWMCIWRADVNGG